MSGYRALAGWGQLKRTSGEKAMDLPSGKTPKQLLESPEFASGELYTKWQRFGGGVTFNVTTNRNINFHNDIGLRTYTVATTGLLEADFSISGFVSAEYMEWLKYALNADCVSYIFHATQPDTPTEGDVFRNTDGTLYVYKDGAWGVLSGVKMLEVDGAKTDTYHYNNLDGPKTFDIAYVQSNTRTNEYGKEGAGDEFHILTGCAVNTFSFSYELSSDAGIKFTLDGYALMDYFTLGDISKDVNDYFEPIPADVFSTACVAVQEKAGETYDTVAQTDSATLTINNFIERRGNCLANWASGYSMGTLNFEMDTSTYANDPDKYMLAMYGYDKTHGVKDPTRIYGVTKVPKVLEGFILYTNDEDKIAKINAKKSFAIVATKAIVSEMGKEYSAENAIMDSPKIRSQNATLCVSYMP